MGTAPFNKVFNPIVVQFIGNYQLQDEWSMTNNYRLKAGWYRIDKEIAGYKKG
jgi:hypothetical protein